MRTSFLAAVLAVLPVVGAAGPVPALTVTDLDGQVHTPFAQKETKAAVFVFVSIDCPIANYYQPSLRRLADRFAKQGVRFYQVHPDPDLRPADARTHAHDFGVTTPVVLDAAQVLTKRLGAKITPEAFVLTPDLATAYRGRIDDTYTTYGKRRPQPTSRDLEAALVALLAGKPIDVVATEAVGCRIFLETPDAPPKTHN